MKTILIADDNRDFAAALKLAQLPQLWRLG
jgi:hypothetical protein